MRTVSYHPGRVRHHPGRLRYYAGRFLLPLLVAVALVGYLAGHGKSHAALGPERTATVSAGSVLLHYPVSWQAVHGAPQVPGLSLTAALVLAPGGDAGRAGLVVGQFPAGESDPVPEDFMALARQMKAPEVVSLPEAQAYRYPDLKLSGFKSTLTVYTIPSPAGASTALACYASSPTGDDMARCEQVVSTLTLVGQSQSYALTPAPAYARALSTWIAGLDRQQLGIRRELGLRVPPATTERLAKSLASVFAKAATDLSALEAPPAAGSAQTRLAASLWRARDAYMNLASVVPGQDAASLASARTQAEAGEAAVNRALERFAWLGYAHS
jgi:hypothetical protein